MPLRFAAKTFRDPVHNIISWKDAGDVGRLVCALTDAREMQRLRHVRQLGLASFVYHGAEHSRFSHSVGVAHVAHRICQRTQTRDEGEHFAIVAAALLHDIGHAPFSHVMERVFGFDHEAESVRIILDESTEVNRILTAVDPSLPRRVTGLITKSDPGWARNVISSQLDADRMDYLLRDAHMTGIGVGHYDLERILLMVSRDDAGLLVDQRAYESVEGYLMARYHMYRLVYFHRTVRSAESMLERLFARARVLMEQGDGSVIAPGGLGMLMRGEPVPVSEWTRLGEFGAWSVITTWADHRDPVLAMLARGLLERRLFRSVDRDLTAPGAEEEDDLQVARIVDSLSPAERFLFVVDEARDLPYRPYAPRDGHARNSVRILGRDGRVYPIEERSPMVKALADAGYRFRRWCYHPDLRSRIRSVTDAVV